LKQYWENAAVVPDVTDEINSLNSGSECDGQSDSKSSSPSNQKPDEVKKNKIENMFFADSTPPGTQEKFTRGLYHLFCHKSNYSQMPFVSFNGI
jgi:hypothetical protein